jgi:regulator of nucleoside diphosphate kinase
MSDVLDRPAVQPNVVVLDREYDPLADLVCASERSSAGLNLLWTELERATLIPAAEAPPGLVRVGSRVLCTDLATGISQLVSLVYPADGGSPDSVSVASRLGAALLGLSAGDVMAYSAGGGGLRRVRIDRVTPPSRAQGPRKSFAELLADLTDPEHANAASKSVPDSDRC